MWHNFLDKGKRGPTIKYIKIPSYKDTHLQIFQIMFQVPTLVPFLFFRACVFGLVLTRVPSWRITFPKYWLSKLWSWFQRRNSSSVELFLSKLGSSDTWEHNNFINSKYLFLKFQPFIIFSNLGTPLCLPFGPLWNCMTLGQTVIYYPSKFDFLFSYSCKNKTPPP